MCKMVIAHEKVRARRRSIRTKAQSYNAASRVYVSPEGEQIFEHLINRRSRPVGEYRKLVLEAHPEFAGMRWSRTAGCACGCSPGFILFDTIRNEDFSPVDFYLTVMSPEDYKARQELAAVIKDIAVMAMALSEVETDYSWIRLAQAA